MTIWDDIVEAANNRDPCDRCGGKGKVPLFSSVEDPCRKCDGFGTLSPSDDDEDSEDDGDSSGTQTKQNTPPTKLFSFLDQQAQTVSQHSQFARSRIDEITFSHSGPPDQKDFDIMVDEFQFTFCATGSSRPKTSFPFACVSAPKPRIFFRRTRNSNVSFNLASRASSFRIFTCWNQIPQSPPDVVPQNTLVVASFVPLQCAVYCQW